MMNKLYIVFGLVLLAGISLARTGCGSDPYMSWRYESVRCYAEYADPLVMTAQGYYTGAGQTPPAYLQTLRDDLDAYSMGYGAMSELAAYCYDGNRFAFDAEVPVVMGLVNQMSRAYRTEARYSIGQAWVDRATVQGYYSSQRSVLSGCLVGST